MPESIVPFEIKPCSAITAEQLKRFEMIIRQWNKSDIDILSLKRIFMKNLEFFCEENKLEHNCGIKVIFQLDLKKNLLKIEFIVSVKKGVSLHKEFTISSEQLAIERDFYFDEDGYEENFSSDVLVDDDLVFDNTFVEQDVRNYNLLLDGVLNYRLRMMQLDEIHCLTKLYKKYEFNCRVNHFKDQDVCLKKMENGTLQIVVAIDIETDAIIAAIGILHSHHCRIPELTAGYVNVAFRTNDLFFDLTSSAMQFIKNECPNGVRTFTFMTNKLTQQAASEEKMDSCGILFAPGALDPAMPYSLLKDIKKQQDLAIPRMLRFCGLTRMPLHIYAPLEHHDIIEEIYNNLSLDVHIEKESLELDLQKMPERGSINCNKCILEYTEIFVERLGQNTFTEVVEIVKEQLAENVSSIIVHCSLDDENSAWFGEQLATLGFAFAGILPWGMHGQERISYQLLHEVNLDSSHSYFLSEFDKKLYNYIAKDIEAKNNSCPFK